MLRSKKTVKFLMAGILALSLVACGEKTEGTKNSSEVAKTEVQMEKRTLLGENLDLYDGIVITKAYFVEKGDSKRLEFELNNGDKIKEYSLKVHGEPVNTEEKEQLKLGYRNWDIAGDKVIENNGKYYLVREIDPKFKNYKLNLALYKTEKSEDGKINWPNYGNQIYLDLNI